MGNRLNGKWRKKEDGIIYLSVTSDGTTGPQWLDRLEGRGFYIVPGCVYALHSKKFQPSNGVTTEVAILKLEPGYGQDRIWSSKNVYAEGSKRRFTEPNLEVACLLRDKLNNDDFDAMGLQKLIVMHYDVFDFGFGRGIERESLFLAMERRVFKECPSGVFTVMRFERDGYGDAFWDYHNTGYAFAVC